MDPEYVTIVLFSVKASVMNIMIVVCVIVDQIVFLSVLYHLDLVIQAVLGTIHGVLVTTQLVKFIVCPTGIFLVVTMMVVYIVVELVMLVLVCYMIMELVLVEEIIHFL